MYKYKEFSPVVANPTTYHYQKAMVLKRYLENETFQNIDNNLIALYGEWGSGKSTVFKTLKAELEKEPEKYTPLIFEAWKYEKDKNLPLSLYEFILDKIINNGDAFKKVLAEGIGKGLYSFFKGLTFNFGPISYEVSKTTEEIDKEDISSLYTLTENFIDNFQKQIEKYRENKKIIVFIDDLDRCDDENIVTLISGLKLMFTLKNIIFICGVDRTAVEESLKLKYQNEEKASMFLKKIFPQDYILDTIKDHIIELYDNDFPKLKNYILENFKISNPRSIFKIYNKYISLLYLTTDEKKHIERKKRFFLFLILCLQEKNLFFRYSTFSASQYSDLNGRETTVLFTFNNDQRIHLYRSIFFENLNDPCPDFDYFVAFVSDNISPYIEKIMLEY